MQTIQIPCTQLQPPAGTRVRASLCKSIRERGILVPILVTREGERYRILDGRRRVAAAQQLKLEVVPAILVERGGPDITILAHATRSENPIAELQAIQELVREGLGEKQIAQAGYAELGRIRRLTRLNRLAPELAEKVEAGQIAAGLAFQIAGLSLEAQRRLAGEEKITGAKVREAKTVRRQAALPDLTALAQFQDLPATLDDVFACLSPRTLDALLQDLPDEERFAAWRGRAARAALTSAEPAP